MGRIVIACYRPKPEKRDALLWVLYVFGIRVAGEPSFPLANDQVRGRGHRSGAIGDMGHVGVACRTGNGHLMGRPA